MLSDREVEEKLTLWGASNPRTELGSLALQASEALAQLRAKLAYERAKADINDHTEEFREIRSRLEEQLADAVNALYVNEEEKAAIIRAIADAESREQFKQADALRAVFSRLRIQGGKVPNAS